MSDVLSPDIAEALARDGYVRIDNVLETGALTKLRSATARILKAASAEHFTANQTTGSMLGVENDPWFAELVALPITLAALGGLGLGRVVWSSGYVISKPAGGPRLFWHQDWMWWNHPVAFDATPHQIFAMFYLVDTDRTNGCLRVVPGSHQEYLPAHDQLTTAHSQAALAGNVDGDTMFSDLEGEIDVPIRAGDLLLGDSRLLHAAHANTSNQPRGLVTLWYHPAYDRLPPELQAHFAARVGSALADWPSQARSLVVPLLPFSDEHTPPLPIDRNPRPRHLG